MINREHWSTASRQIFFWHYFCFWVSMDLVQNLPIKIKNCSWTWSMTGGPWTRSMKVVHGPGPKRGSMDPWSLFCPHPTFYGFTGVITHAGCWENMRKACKSQAEDEWFTSNLLLFCSCSKVMFHHICLPRRFRLINIFCMITNMILLLIPRKLLHALTFSSLTT